MFLLHQIYNFNQIYNLKLRGTAIILQYSDTDSLLDLCANVEELGR